jgi:hypothetical protein
MCDTPLTISEGLLAGFPQRATCGAPARSTRIISGIRGSWFITTSCKRNTFAGYMHILYRSNFYLPDFPAELPSLSFKEL